MPQALPGRHGQGTWAAWQAQAQAKARTLRLRLLRLLLRRAEEPPAEIHLLPRLKRLLLLLRVWQGRPLGRRRAVKASRAERSWRAGRLRLLRRRVLHRVGREPRQLPWLERWRGHLLLRRRRTHAEARRRSPLHPLDARRSLQSENSSSLLACASRRALRDVALATRSVREKDPAQARGSRRAACSGC